MDEDMMNDDEYAAEYEDENNSSPKDTKPSEDNQVHLPPTMEKTWTTYTSEIGEQAKIRCPVKNKGAEVIMWYKGEELIGQDHVALQSAYEIDNEFSLVVRKVKGSDEGEFTCKLVPSRLLSSAKLYVKQPPVVKITDGNRDIMDRTMTFREGDKIRLVCAAQGFPIPELRWDTKHHRLSDMPGVIVTKGELIVENAEPHHSGIYECHALNENGQTATGSVHIVIECKKGLVWPILGTILLTKCHLLQTFPK